MAAKYQDIRVETDLQQYRSFACSQSVGKGTCSQPAHVIERESFDGPLWPGEAWCDAHDPRKA